MSFCSAATNLSSTLDNLTVGSGDMNANISFNSFLEMDNNNSAIEDSFSSVNTTRAARAPTATQNDVDLSLFDPITLNDIHNNVKGAAGVAAKPSNAPLPDLFNLSDEPNGNFNMFNNNMTFSGDKPLNNSRNFL